MSENYVPQVGDRIRLRNWGEIWIDVNFIDGDTIFGRCSNGVPDLYALDSPWIKVEKPRPLPERWLTTDGSGRYAWVLERADRDVYRVWSDVDGAPRIERVTL